MLKLQGKSMKKLFSTASKNPRIIIYVTASALAVMVMVTAAVLRMVFSELPSISQFEDYTPALTTRVFDANNQVIAEFSIEKRALIPLNKMPVDIQNAVIAMEDSDFFNHYGVSLKGIFRALVRDILHRRIAQGGSTITQQLAKLILLKPEKKLMRKLREMALAVQIESKFSKQEILQLYLNQIYFGEGAYGVGAAAKIYFGKEISQLTLGECALLVGIIPSPATYSPFGHLDTAKTRRSLVLQRMYEESYITSEEKDKAEQEPVSEVKPPFIGSTAPYFIEYIRRILEPKYGVNTLWKGGLSIYTTLDLAAQKAAETIMEKNLAVIDEEVRKELEANPPEPSEDEEESSEAKAPPRLQGAFFAMDVKSGAIKVMIGGRDYKETQFNRVTQATRQPGSSFKPFVWLTALMNGYTAATIIEDKPLAYYFDGREWRIFEGATDQYSIDLATQPFVGNKDFKIWTPVNVDKKTLGKITLRRGLELSRNLASVYLIDKLGPSAVVETAKKAGIKRPLDPVLSLSLGTSVVSMIEMVNGFSTFTNGGIRVEPYGIIRVTDQHGKTLEEHSPTESEQFSPQYSFLITNLMRGVVDRGTGNYARRLKRPLAGKTGTSQDHRDLWFIGMTPDISAGAWMGYDDFSSIESRDWTGGSTVVPWWTEIMQEILKEQPVREFPVPEGISFVLVDPDTGNLALPTCKRKFMEAFLKGTEPKTFCEIEH
ncbi:MAG: transglycosylase domain-containing protein [Elusimicrobia bacterium]|nr:transglycosylase domain-containing protein [Elusimicrobiota bacterium]